ncbi:MAG TPA: alkaline phosphatase [Vicinamibacteria bacterium]|nr:alkaline phosphatase [Vicinamibacteria bacterium]
MKICVPVSCRLRFLLAALALVATSAQAAPTIRLIPPSGARFLVGQRFDLRVEGQGTGPFSATLAVDGVALPFTSGAQNTLATDGATSAGWGGFNRRGFSLSRPGHHTVSATFTDATGTASASADVEVIRVGDGGEIRNVIIMLGDGMGVAHRTAARLVKYGVTAGQPNGWLAMDEFPGTGLVTTHSLNSIITDSAPGMACYVTGSHAQNGQEGVFPASMTNPFYYPRVEYLSEYLHRTRGSALGIVTTADVEDATPAANAVHTGNRNAGQGIVDQYFDDRERSGLAVLMGGGRRWFLPQGTFGSSRGTGNDYAVLPVDLQQRWGAAAGTIDPSRDLISEFQAAGFSYADSASSLQAALASATPPRLLGLFGYGNMNVALDKVAKRRSPTIHGVVDDYHAPDQPMLDEMTQAALSVLARRRGGFVLMVEGAHIDKQSHLMDPDRVIGETIEFDNAVGVAGEFARHNPGTLVLVLADHECSGFSLIGALTGGIAGLQALAPDNGVTDPATQPGRQKVVGTYDAAGFPRYQIEPDGYPASFDVDQKILVGFGANADRYEGWLGKPLPVIDSLLSGDIKAELAGEGYAAQPYLRAESAFGFFIRGQAAGQDQAVHTAADIPVSAYSRGNAWRSFVGVQTNTDVFFKIARLLLGPADPGRGDEDR